MTTLFEDLNWRGLVHQSTDPEHLANWLAEEPRTLYAGFDPTAPSLHVGNLLQLLLLRRFQRAGHRPIVLVGGATGMIGDPSGRSEERNLLTADDIDRHIEGQRKQLTAFLDFDTGTNSAVLINNHDWMGRFGYLDFLRDVGKNFPLGVMLTKDSVKSRLDSEAGLSYTEFSYMLLQAYDFVELFDRYDCRLQVGGSDQWGNITAGIDLGRRMRSAQLFALTTPLLTKSDGSKMGKTADGAIWLDPDRTSPYQFFQYWLNVEDADVPNCLRMLTELPHNEIESLEETVTTDPQKRAAQRRLAEELTALVHGSAGLESAERASKILFGGEIENLTDNELTQIFADVPSSSLPTSALDAEGLNVIDAFAATDLAKSKGEARRTISGGGAYVNNRRIEDIERNLTRDDLASETVMVLRAGKKRYALLRFAD